MGMDIKDFYLNNDLPRKEYIQITIKLIPEEIIELYNLKDFVHKGFVYAYQSPKACTDYHKQDKSQAMLLSHACRKQDTSQPNERQEYSSTKQTQSYFASASTISESNTPARKMQTTFETP
jgi:hypothetical protein